LDQKARGAPIKIGDTGAGYLKVTLSTRNKCHKQFCECECYGHTCDDDLTTAVLDVVDKMFKDHLKHMHGDWP
jgi:hypothetical protein